MNQSKPTLTFRPFSLGDVVATRGALGTAREISGDRTDNLQHDVSPVLIPMLTRHSSGDWGDLCADDKALNIAALHDGSRILSAYKISRHKFYVITDAADDEGIRRHTTVMLAEEY
jgi:hypothetical protein